MGVSLCTRPYPPSKVSDFGLSRTIGDEAIATRTYGTVTHMPMEVLMEGRVSKAADVYSFGGRRGALRPACAAVVPRVARAGCDADGRRAGTQTCNAFALDRPAGLQLWLPVARRAPDRGCTRPDAGRSPARASPMARPQRTAACHLAPPTLPQAWCCGRCSRATGPTAASPTAK